MVITGSYKPLCFHGIVADDEEPDPERDDRTAEIATNKTWRGIMVRARKTHGMSQADLGKLVKMSQAMISKIETGDSGGSSEILAICDILKITPPQHFADEWQKKWAELGQLLRHKNPTQAAAALVLVETMANAPAPAADAPSLIAPVPLNQSDRRK